MQLPQRQAEYSIILGAKQTNYFPNIELTPVIFRRGAYTHIHQSSWSWSFSWGVIVLRFDTHGARRVLNRPNVSRTAWSA
jgi:hypothetical protein